VKVPHKVRQPPWAGVCISKIKIRFSKIKNRLTFLNLVLLVLILVRRLHRGDQLSELLSVVRLRLEQGARVVLLDPVWKYANILRWTNALLVPRIIAFWAKKSRSILMKKDHIYLYLIASFFCRFHTHVAAGMVAVSQWSSAIEKLNLSVSLWHHRHGTIHSKFVWILHEKRVNSECAIDLFYDEVGWIIYLEIDL